MTFRLDAIGASATRVRLAHDGWDRGDEWDRTQACFARAWRRVVLPRLRFRFEHGPLDRDQFPDNLLPAPPG